MSFSKKGGWQRAQISTKKCYKIKKKRISTFLLKRGGKGRVGGRGRLQFLQKIQTLNLKYLTKKADNFFLCHY